MSFTNYMELKVLNDLLAGVAHALPASLYIGLSTANPGEDEAGLAEPSGGSYARVTVARNATNWPAAAAGAIDNGVVFTFPTATGSWGICTYWGLWDAATTGNLLIYAALTTSRTITSGMTPDWAAGAMIVTLD